jgi:hypothetical protein
MRPHILEELSWPMQVIAGHFIYKKTVQTLHGQGTGRFTDEEIATFRLEIWENINKLLELSKKKLQTKSRDEIFWLLGGSHPSEADMILFGMIVSVLICAA